MVCRTLRWGARVAALVGLAGVLAGPAVMALADCAPPKQTEHSHSHHQETDAPRHCCDLCCAASETGVPVVPSSAAAHGAAVRVTAPVADPGLAIVVAAPHLHPFALGPPPLLV